MYLIHNTAVGRKGILLLKAVLNNLNNADASSFHVRCALQLHVLKNCLPDHLSLLYRISG